MPTDDQTSEGVSTEGGTVETKPSEQQASTGSLDEISDIEELRTRAKQLEGKVIEKEKIIARHRDKAKTQEPAPAAAAPQNFAKAEDLAVIVTNQAKELVSDDVREHWDDLVKIELGGYDPRDARSIAQNMNDRLVIFKARQGEKPDTGKDLTKSPGIRGSAGKAPAAKPTHTIYRPLTADEQAKRLYGE